MNETTPRYNLKVIVRETGINPATLRAWERRYELPMPDRTPGGHRLYSQRDLETVKWLMAREQEGLRIGQAAQLWRDLEESGQDPLNRAAAAAPGARTVSDAALEDLANLRQAWIAACLAFDEEKVERQEAHALARHAPELVIVELLQKGLSEVGRLWYEGQATVQQEHFASTVTLRRVNALLADAPPATRAQTILLACPPREEHAFPLLLLTLLLRYRGWPASFLGANVPVSQLEHALENARPNLFVLAAQTLPAAAAALTMARFLHDHDTPLAYGGLIFNRLPRLQDKMPGFFLGEDLQTAAQEITGILTEQRETPAADPVPQSYARALACFNRRRPLLENHVLHFYRNDGVALPHLTIANLHLGDGIRAALTFGDMSLVQHEIDWVRQLIANHGFAPETLTNYLAIYHQMAGEHLDPDCQPILDYLAASV